MDAIIRIKHKLRGFKSSRINGISLAKYMFSNNDVIDIDDLSNDFFTKMIKLWKK